MHKIKSDYTFKIEDNLKSTIIAELLYLNDNKNDEWIGDQSSFDRFTKSITYKQNEYKIYCKTYSSQATLYCEIRNIPKLNIIDMLQDYIANKIIEN